MTSQRKLLVYNSSWCGSFAIPLVQKPSLIHGVYGHILRANMRVRTLTGSPRGFALYFSDTGLALAPDTLTRRGCDRPRGLILFGDLG